MSLGASTGNMEYWLLFQVETFKFGNKIAHEPEWAKTNMSGYSYDFTFWTQCVVIRIFLHGAAAKIWVGWSPSEIRTGEIGQIGKNPGFCDLYFISKH